MLKGENFGKAVLQIEELKVSRRSPQTPPAKVAHFDELSDNLTSGKL